MRATGPDTRQGPCEALRGRRRRQAAERLALGPLWVDTGHVFTTATGTPLDPRNVNRWWSALCERAGVGHRRFHAARHTAATLLLDQGVPLEVVSAVLGHAGLAIAADVYAKVGMDAKRWALATLADKGVTHFTVGGLWGSAGHSAARKDTARTNPVCEVT